MHSNKGRPTDQGHLEDQVGGNVIFCSVRGEGGAVLSRYDNDSVLQ